MATNAKKASKTSRSKSAPAVRPTPASSRSTTVKAGVLDPKETITAAIALILRHPRNEQPGIIAEVYKGVRLSLQEETRQVESNYHSLNECGAIMNKLMEDAHHGSVNIRKDYANS